MDEVLNFIESHELLRHSGSGSDGSIGSNGSGTSNGPVSDADGGSNWQDGSPGAARILATGGGAFKFASQFQVQTLFSDVLRRHPAALSTPS